MNLVCDHFTFAEGPLNFVRRRSPDVSMVEFLCPGHVSNINYVNTQHNYVVMQLIYVNMQHNYMYVIMRDNYVNMQLKPSCMSTLLSCMLT